MPQAGISSQSTGPQGDWVSRRGGALEHVGGCILAGGIGGQDHKATSRASQYWPPWIAALIWAYVVDRGTGFWASTPTFCDSGSYLLQLCP